MSCTLASLASRFAFLGASACAFAASALASPQCPTGVEIAGLGATDAAAGRYFGGALAIDGDRLVVGADSGDGSVPRAGAAYVFARSAGAWSLEAELHPPSPVDAFGIDVDIDGATIVVGSPFDAPLGAVHVYVASGSSWIEQATILPPPTTTNIGSFGRAVAVSGDLLAVGSPFAGTCCPFFGEVDLYARVGASWSLVTTIASPGLQAFGAPLDLDGSHLAVAAPHPFPFDVPGYVLTYEEAGGSWLQSGQLASGWNFSDSFGRALELDGDRLAIGHSSSSEVPEDVYLFAWSGASWLIEQIVPPISGSQMEFGRSVAVDGDRLAVGANYDDESGIAAGSVHVYERVAGLSQPFGELAAAQPVDESLLGWSVAIEGATVAAGAPDDDQVALNAGSVHVFALLVPPVVYCVAQTNSQGCVPKVEGLGTPSFSSAAPFTVSSISLINRKNGLLFYGTAGRLAAPFQGGTLCVRPPLERTPVQSSGGSASGADCTGSLAFDFNAWMQSGLDPALAPGATVDAQFWSRDPSSASGTNLTDAIEFVPCP